MTDTVNHPSHYKADNGIEAIDVVEGFGLNFRIGNAVTYLLRHQRKGQVEDLQKAAWYIAREIAARGWGPEEPEQHPPLYYLATPYSKYTGGIEKAFRDAAALTARLLKLGLHCYSPIAHTHPVAKYGKLDPLDHTIWLPFDEAMMRACDGLIVACMPGWRRSKGVRHEIEWFRKADKPVAYLDPKTLLITPEAA